MKLCVKIVIMSRMLYINFEMDLLNVAQLVHYPIETHHLAIENLLA